MTHIITISEKLNSKNITYLISKIPMHETCIHIKIDKQAQIEKSSLLRFVSALGECAHITDLSFSGIDLYALSTKTRNELFFNLTNESIRYIDLSNTGLTQMSYEDVQEMMHNLADSITTLGMTKDELIQIFEHIPFHIEHIKITDQTTLKFPDKSIYLLPENKIISTTQYLCYEFMAHLNLLITQNKHAKEAIKFEDINRESKFTEEGVLQLINCLKKIPSYTALFACALFLDGTINSNNEADINIKSQNLYDAIQMYIFIINAPDMYVSRKQMNLLLDLKLQAEFKLLQLKISNHGNSTSWVLDPYEFKIIPKSYLNDKKLYEDLTDLKNNVLVHGARVMINFNKDSQFFNTKKMLIDSFKTKGMQSYLKKNFFTPSIGLTVLNNSNENKNILSIE